MKRALICVASAALAAGFTGCLSNSGLEPTPTPTETTWREIPDRCYGRICVSDGSGPSATYFREKYGLRQILTGGGGGDDIDQDLMVAQTTLVAGGRGTQSILGYNLSSGRLIPIDPRPYVDNDTIYHWDVLPRISKGRVVFSRSDVPGDHPEFAGGNPLRPMVWDSATGLVRQLPTGLQGSQQTRGFDGAWVLILNENANVQQAGVWGYNVDTGDLVRVYQPPPPEEVGGPKSEYIRNVGLDVVDGHAYVGITRYRPTGKHVITETNLTAGITRVVVDDVGGQIGTLKAGQLFVAWTIDPSDFGYYNRMSGGYARIDRVGGGELDVDGAIATHNTYTKVSARNLTSGNATDLFVGDLTNISPLGLVADGRRFVTEMNVHKPEIPGFRESGVYLGEFTV